MPPRHLTDFRKSDGGRLKWHHDLTTARANSLEKKEEEKKKGAVMGF